MLKVGFVEVLQVGNYPIEGFDKNWFHQLLFHDLNSRESST